MLPTSNRTENVAPYSVATISAIVVIHHRGVSSVST